MAAGLGFKDFTTGEVLTANDVDGYLMQGIWVFANATARDAAVTSPQEGNACYLKDTDVIMVYSGSAWATQSASNPISANIVDAKGDLIAATAADTVARLAVGANNTVLTADSTTATGLKWATPNGAGLVFIQKGTFSATATVNVNTCFSSTYDNYRILVKVTGASVVNGEVRLRMRSATTDNTSANYNYQRLYAQSTSVGGSSATNQTSAIMGPQNTALSWFATDMWSPFLAENTGYVTVSSYNQTHIDNFSGAHKVASSFDGFTMFPDAGTITGEVWVYGYAK
jgi:hypothetical protein